MTLLDFYIDDRLDQTETLVFKIPATDPKAEFVVADSILQWRGRKYYIGEIDQERTDSSTITVTCPALWQRLGERKYVGSLNIEARTLAEGLDTILEGTGWTRGPLTATGGTAYSMEQQDQYRLGIVRSWAGVTATVVVWDTVNQTVDLIPAADRGVNRGIGFRYGRNIKSIQRHLEPPRVTRLYPYGRDDLDIGSINDNTPYLDDFSFYTAQGLTLAEAEALYTKEDVWVNTDIVDQAALLAAAQIRLGEVTAPQIEYRLGVVDLTELTNTPDDDLEVGDTVTARDSDLGWDVETTVVRRVSYPLEPWRNQVELSYLYNPADPNGGTNSRPQSSLQWEMFQSRSSRLVLRQNATWIANRIPLAFAGAAEAVYGYDVSFTGVGTGSLRVSAIDAESGELEHDILEIPYADGVVSHRSMTWSHDSSDPLDALNGQKDYRIRVQAVDTGGGSSSATGINIEEFGSRFWILARGATKRTPEFTNSERFEYTGAEQFFTVPDGVEQVEMEVVAAGSSYEVDGYSGKGGKVVGTMVVVPGSVLKVVVGGKGTGAGAAAQTAVPSLRGGNGDSVTGFNAYAGGGGSGVFPDGATTTPEGYLIAGGAGGNGQPFGSGSYQVGGHGGFFAGQPTDEITQENGFANATGAFPGSPADLYGGGGLGNPGGSPGFLAGTNGETGGNGTGGVGGNATNSFTFAPGGGGGGYNGGGGAGSNNSSGSGNGGGGGGACGFASEEVFDIEVTDGFQLGDGYIEFRWNTPA